MRSGLDVRFASEERCGSESMTSGLSSPFDDLSPPRRTGSTFHTKHQRFRKYWEMPHETSDTVMTPKLASFLMGWATGDLDSVLGAVLSTFLCDEVHCTINGDNNQIVTVRMYGPNNIGRSDELVDFVLAITDSEGEPEFQSVMIDIRCFIHAVRTPDKTLP